MSVPAIVRTDMPTGLLETPARQFWHVFRRDRLAMAGLVVLALLLGTAWATAAVYVQLKTRARALGLACQTLRPLRRVESARDARAVGFLNY